MKIIIIYLVPINIKKNKKKIEIKGNNNGDE